VGNAQAHTSILNLTFSITVTSTELLGHRMLQC